MKSKLFTICYYGLEYLTVQLEDNVASSKKISYHKKNLLFATNSMYNMWYFDFKCEKLICLHSPWMWSMWNCRQQTSVRAVSICICYKHSQFTSSDMFGSDKIVKIYGIFLVNKTSMRWRRKDWKKFCIWNCRGHGRLTLAIRKR